MSCPFSLKKCAKMSVFVRENRKNSLAAGGLAPSPPSFRRLGAMPPDPPVVPPTFPNPECATALRAPPQKISAYATADKVYKKRQQKALESLT